MYEVVMDHNTVKVIAVHKKGDGYVREYKAIEIVVHRVDLKVACKGGDIHELEEGVYNLHREDHRFRCR